MSRSKSRRPRSRTGQTAAFETDPRFDRTYVAVVHGIGEESAANWAAKSVQQLVDWWEGTTRHVSARVTECPADCTIPDPALHRHVELSDGERSRRIDVEPVYWGGEEQVTRPGYLHCAWLAVEAAMVIILVDLLAYASRQAPSPSPSHAATNPLWRLFRSPWMGLGFLARALAIPVVVPLAFVVPLVSSRLNAKLGDAFAWGVDHKGSRARITEHVSRRIRAQRAQSVILIGHSQGGSILAGVEHKLRGRVRDVQLITVGSGHAILAAVNLARQQGKTRWGRMQSVMLLAPLFVIGCVVSYFVWSSWALLFRPLVGWAVFWLDYGASIWQLDRTAVAGFAARHGTKWWEVSLGQQLHRSMALLVLLPGLVMLLATVFAFTKTMLGDRPAELGRAVRTRARGIDIVASRDPVALAMLGLGEPDRVRRVPQSASLLKDHTAYFRNSCSVLPVLAEAIERTAGLRPAQDEDAAPASSYLQAGLVVRRSTRPWLIELALLLTIPAQKTLPLWLAIPTVAVVCVASSCLVSASCVRWLAKASKVAARPQYAAGLYLLRRGNTRRRLLWSYILGVVALILIGGGIVVTTASSDGLALAGYRDISAIAFVLGQLIAICAWMTMFGVPWANWAAAICLAASIPLWLAHHTAFGTAAAIMSLLMAGYAFSRGLRYVVGCRRMEGSVGRVQPSG